MDHITFTCLFIALSVLDAISTFLVINRGGIEKNPVVRWFMSQLGNVPGLFVVKVLAIGLVMLLGPWSLFFQGVLLATGFIVVLNNALVFKGLSK